jgi:DNA-binding HxlR family transcriptional regulator
MKLSRSPVKLETKDGCIACAANILGSKWTALILRDLNEGPRRFKDFEQSLPGISPRTLSQRLDELEKEAIVTKQSFAEVPPRVEYSLTDKGKDLLPILRSMANWGKKYS